jgi:hypothetical protein
MAYKLPEDGYYYFRPYNYTHIPIHQEFVSRWGGDQRNPYSFEVFDQLDTEELPSIEPSDPPGSSIQPMQPYGPRPSPPVSQSMPSPMPRAASVKTASNERPVDLDRLGIVCGDD